MELSSILSMFCGIGLFLYGMNLMGQSLERFAGARMEKTLEKLISSNAKGVLLGTGVTAVIQSSSATIIMVIGFLNAGILRLTQAVPVIMGANIGTTVTAQILRLGDINNNNIILQMMKPTSFAPVCVLIGAFVILIAKKPKTKDKAGIAVGLGILFTGMSMMEGSFRPLASSPEFMQTFMVLTNPILGVLAGMFVTILLQSSSASVGVLQAMSATGAITFSMMVPIVIGQNVGKCVTVLLASIGTNKNSRRAVCIDITMSVAGAIIFLAGIYLYQKLFGFSFWNETVNRGRIADFHTLFNIVTCVIMLPFIQQLINFSKKIVKDKNPSKMEQELALLDPIFLNKPTVALEQCKKVMTSMTDVVMENYRLSTECLFDYTEEKAEKIRTNEEFLDMVDSKLSAYLVKLTEQQLDSDDNRLITEFMFTVGDFERIGDHCCNLLDSAEANMEMDAKFSGKAFGELKYLVDAVGTALDSTVKGYREEKESYCHQVGPIEDIVDIMVDIMKANRVQRLQKGDTTIDASITYVEVLINMERISDHCTNISMQLHQRLNKENIDVHKSHVIDRDSEEYKVIKAGYEKLYLDPIMNS